MAGTVSFKVYMTTEDDSPKEVRRFGVEADVVTNFVYLREKLQTIFPKLRGKHFTVTWKDADGDDVTISSDEELQIALEDETTSSRDIRKLYVSLHSEYSSSRNDTNAAINGNAQSNDTGPIHVGVMCDGCDKQIQGFRYKCVQCPDYDLCMDCETRGSHPEHCMIRLSLPLQWKPHYGRRLATQVNRFVKKAHASASKDDEIKQCPFKSGKHHGKSRHASGNNAPSWIDTFATYLDDWANLPGECPMKETTKTANEAKENVSAADSSNEAKTSKRDNDTSPAEQIRLLTNVGLAVGENFLSQFLDPLVNMQAKNEKSTGATAAHSTCPAATTSASASSSSSASSSTSVSPNSERQQEASTSHEETSKFPGEGKKLRDTSSVNVEAGASSQTAPSSEKSSAEKVYFDNEGWTLLNKSDSPTPSVILPASTGAVPKQVQPTAPVEASANSIYPKLPEASQKKPEEAPIVYHSNPTIQKSVESMIQMGFTNEGGWLTNLLVSKSGDIAAALDALSPVRR